MEKGSHVLKGFVRAGSSAANYIGKSAKRAGDRGPCNFSFVVYGHVRKANAKLGFGPQFVIEVGDIAKN